MKSFTFRRFFALTVALLPLIAAANPEKLETFQARESYNTIYVDTHAPFPPEIDNETQARALAKEAAVVLGASGWQTFYQITLPNIKWGLLYGAILCNARAMGEFGAVSVVSGHIRGSTNTMPLHVEILYNEYNFAAAFAVASLLALLALVTLALKTLIEFRNKQHQKSRGHE